MPDLLVHGHRSTRASSPDSWLRLTPRLEPGKCRRRRRRDEEDHGPFRLPQIIRDAGNLVLSWRNGFSDSEREGRRRAEERMQILAARMENAATLQEWAIAAAQLDELEGNDLWKLDDASGDYQPELIRARLAELDAARTNCDITTMLYLVRTALSRDLGGMGNVDLYRHSYTGTKTLIERYVNSVLETLKFLVQGSTCQTELDPQELLEGMIYARQGFGRSALLLSGGATFGMAHIGVLKTLYQAKLLPRIISGASAGSIVCSVVCTRTDEEIPGLIEAFPYGDLRVFHGDKDGYLDHFRRFLTKGNWSNKEHLTRVMRDWLGDLTFQEAYNRTRRICNICVSSASIYDVPRLLNYITAPNVLIWSAVAASCSVPGVFQSTSLMTKDPATGEERPWNPAPQQVIDGSVDNDLPMTRLAEMFNVNHFIVSQVNPHVIPFLPKDDQLYPATAAGGLPRRMSSPDNGDWVHALTSLAKEETQHRMHFLTELGIFPGLLTKLRAILSQKYYGDITILPEVSLSNFRLILRNPTPDFMLRNCLIGEKATWPKLSRIRDQLAIELALDQAVHDLRTLVVFKDSPLDLRRSVGYWQPHGFQMDFTKAPAADKDVAGQMKQDQLLGRRRGSGSSIQLIAARHKKSFPDADDDHSDEGERLELKPRARTKGDRPGSRRTVSKPRLKRSSKSHTHMRGGQPADTRAGDGISLPAYDFPKPIRPSGDDSATGADDTAPEDAAQTSAPRNMAPLSLLEAEGASQASDGGLQSDSDPYQGRVLSKKEEPSKLRYSVL